MLAPSSCYCCIRRAKQVCVVCVHTFFSYGPYCSSVISRGLSFQWTSVKGTSWSGGLSTIQSTYYFAYLFPGMLVCPFLTLKANMIFFCLFFMLSLNMPNWMLKLLQHNFTFIDTCEAATMAIKDQNFFIC